MFPCCVPPGLTAPIEAASNRTGIAVLHCLDYTPHPIPHTLYPTPGLHKMCSPPVRPSENCYMGYSISELNQMNQATFVTVLGAVFEETPTIAQQAWRDRPFTDISDLHQKMVAVVRKMALAEQLALIQAHPDLGSRVKMAANSVQEQAGAGLSQLPPEEYARFQALNTAYREKFGFPFVMAVKGQSKASILAAFETRLEHHKDQEISQALSEITQIARFRLDDLID